MMAANNLEHYFASSPLWVVLLCNSEYFIASLIFLLKHIGTGANLINEPLPLLNFSPSIAYSVWFAKNSPIDIEIFPPSPIE